MPQGSRLGPLSFIVIIDDLTTHCGLDKFVDDTTLSELLPPSASVSNMPLYFESILTWTVNNDMQINISKTKEIILGRISQTTWNLSPLQLAQSNELLLLNYLAFTLMTLLPGPRTLMLLHPRQLNVFIS